MLGRADASGGDRDEAGKPAEQLPASRTSMARKASAASAAGKSVTESAASMSAQDGLSTHTSTSMISG